MQTAQLHPNVMLLRYHAMMREMNFLIPVVVLYLQWRGISFAQFMMVQSIFAVVMLFAEPLISPLADKYGRKNAILTGSVFWILGHVAIWLSTNWQVYTLAEALLGIGLASYGPATKALLYDSFLSTHQEGAHYEANSGQVSWQSYAGGVGMLIGGLLYLVHPLVAMFATLASTLLLLPLAWRLTEAPYHTRISEGVMSYRQMWQAVWNSLSSPATRWLVIMPGLITGSTITLFWSFQPTFAHAQVPTAIASAFLAGHFFLRGWFAGKCRSVASKLNIRQCFGTCIVALAVGFPSMAFLPWWMAYVPFVIAAGFAYVLADTMGQELVHRHVQPDVRATALGGYALVGRVVSVLTLGGCSLLQPALGLPGALLVIGTTSVVLATITFTRLPSETEKSVVAKAA